MPRHTHDRRHFAYASNIDRSRNQPFSPNAVSKGPRTRNTTVVPSVCPYSRSAAVSTSTFRTVIDIKGNPESPINEGTLCPKGPTRSSFRLIRTVSRRCFNQDGALPGALFRSWGAEAPRLSDGADRRTDRGDQGARLREKARTFRSWPFFPVRLCWLAISAGLSVSITCCESSNQAHR